MYQRRTDQEREKIIKEYIKLRAQKVSMHEAAKILNVPRGTLNDYWFKAKKQKPTVVIHDAEPVKRAYTKRKVTLPTVTNSTRCFVIVTDTTSLKSVLEQL